MNHTMNVENLNLSISNILDGYQSKQYSKCSLSEQELREVQDELFEFVPIEDDFDYQYIQEEEDSNFDCNKQQQKEQSDFNRDRQLYDEQKQNSPDEESCHSNYTSTSSEECNSEYNDQRNQNRKSKSDNAIKRKQNSICSNATGSTSIETNEQSIRNQVTLQNNIQTSTFSNKKAKQSQSDSQDIKLKKKKICKLPKKNEYDRSIKLGIIDIFKRKEQVQKCNMKLKVPYPIKSNCDSYFLLGDVLIEMDFSSNTNSGQQNCVLNMYKPVQRVVYNNKTRCLSMFQASSNEFLVDFDFLSKLLIQYPDQNIHLLGRLIEKYQDIVKLLHLQIRNVRTLSGFTQELINQRRTYFDEQVNAFLQKIDEHQMYFIQKFHTNYQNASFEAYEVGYSRQFLALLGTDENTITNIILRKGKPELYNFESRLKIMLVRMLSIVQGKFKGAQSDFEIYTFDNIRVYARLKILPVCIEYPEHLKLPLDNYNEINCMAFGLIDVDPNMIQQIITMRKQDKYHSHLKSFVQELNYTKQSEQFLEKYYEMTKNKYIQDRQNLQKRKQITKDNEQILLNHQQMQIYHQNENEKSNQLSQNQSLNMSINSFEEKYQDQSRFLYQDALRSQNISSPFKFMNTSKTNSEIGKNDSPFKCDIESDLIKYNQFNYIDENYISQDIQLSRGDEGEINIIESCSPQLYSLNKHLNSSFIDPTQNLVNTFAKSHRIIQIADQNKPQQLDSINFEFNISLSK